MKNFKLIIISGIIFFLSNIISQVNAKENDSDHERSRTFELVYKAVINGDEINKGELLSVSEVDTKIVNDDILDYINSLLFVENTNQIESVIAVNDSISFKTSTEGLINNIYIYYPNKKLKISINMSYDNMSRLKLCTIRDVEANIVDAISYTYDNYGRLTIKICNRTGGDMYQERYAYKDDNIWYVKVLFKEYHPLLYFERKTYIDD